MLALATQTSPPVLPLAAIPVSPTDTIAQALLALLPTATLDPRFEQFGGFIYPQAEGVRFFGNFLHVSHVFDVVVQDALLISAITAAIAANMATEEYRLARHDGAARDALRAWARSRNRWDAIRSRIATAR